MSITITRARCDSCFDDLAIWPYSGSSVLMSLARSSCLARLTLSVSLCFDRSWKLLQTLSRVPAQSFGTATQTSNISLVKDDWWVNIWRMRTSVASCLTEIHTDVDISSTLTFWRPRGLLDAQHEFFLPSLLNTELSYSPASDHS